MPWIRTTGGPLAGDPVDRAPPVQDDLPLLELRHRRVTLAKGHTRRRMLRLITIPISHYCEKARWALERAGIPYREEPHVQGLHRWSTRGGPAAASTVPVLVTPEGAIGESEQILEWVDARSEPAARLFGAEGAERERRARAVPRASTSVSGRRAGG